MFNEEAEGRMVLAQLEKISKLSAALMDKISDGDDLEGWVQNKIDLAEDYVQTVYDYLTYNADSVSEEVTNEDLRNWFSKTHPKGNWVRIGTDGEIKGDCAREKGEGKPKCLPKQKAQSMSKEARAKAARRKRREDPQADRPGTGNKPINVKTEEVQYLEEKNTPTNPKLWARAKALAKQKFDVYPSAYANGWAAKWYKSKGGSWKTKSEEFVQEKKMKTFAEFKNTLNECACENVIVEKSPDDPEIEKWIKSNKARFKKEYGEKKGTEVLYAKAWDMYNKKHKK